MGSGIIAGERFADVSSAVGLDLMDDARGMAIVDWDRDGDLDLWIANRTGPRVRLMLNEIHSSPSHISFRLRGTRCNRDAIGARVELVLNDDRIRIKTLRAGEGFLSQSGKSIHFGLANDEIVKEVKVRWPGNDEPQSFYDLQSNGRYLLVEGEQAAERIENRPNATLTSESNEAPASTADSSIARIILTQRRRMPDVAATDFNGAARTCEYGSSGTLINLWASWCEPCLKELADFNEHVSRLNRQGVKLIALSVDEDAVAAQSMAQEMNLDFCTDMATQEFLRSITELDHEIFYRARPLPLPCSFLLDSKGQLAVIYKGTVAANQVVDDIALLTKTLPELADAAQPFAGKRIASWFAPGHINVARAYVDGGYLVDAKRELRLELQQPVNRSNHIAALQMLSEIAAAENDTREQFAVLEVLKKLRPENHQIRLQQVVLLASDGNAAAAREMLSDVAANIGDNPSDLAMLAQVYARLGNPGKAVTVLERAVSLAPDDANIRVGLAIARQFTGDIEGAVGEYRSVLALNPNQHEAANNLAWLLASSDSADRIDESISLARRVCDQTNNANPAFLDTLAYALESRGADDAAARVLEKAIPIAKGRGEFELMDKMSARLSDLAK